MVRSVPNQGFLWQAMLRETMPSGEPRRRPIAALIVILAVLALTFLLASPLPAAGSPPSPSAGAPSGAPISAAVTWNGINITTLNTVSSALAIDFGQSANLNYIWNNVPAPGINDVRLQMFYFGFAVATRDVTLSIAETSSKGVPLNWTPLSIGYVLEGVYRLTASLVAPNGTTMWSYDFYVRGNAPLGFVAVIPIVLLALGVYEVYALARSGRYAALGRKPQAPPPTSPTPPTTPPSGGTGPTDASGGAAAPSADSTGPPPTEGATPPSGGSS